MKRWNILKHDREQVAKLAKELDILPIIAALLISRGFETYEKAHKFFAERLRKGDEACFSGD
jgi:hypothetical protein